MNTYVITKSGPYTIEKSEDSSSFTVHLEKGSKVQGDMLMHGDDMCDLALENGFCIPLCPTRLFHKVTPITE